MWTGYRPNEGQDRILILFGWRRGLPRGSEIEPMTEGGVAVS